MHHKDTKLRIHDDKYRRVHYIKSPYLFNENTQEIPMSFRIVRVHLGNDNYECLLTNLPADTYDIYQLKEIYHMRWGIETSFRHLKYSVGLLEFHSKKIEFIEQEIWARLTLYNFCMAVTLGIDVPHRTRKHQYKFNVANAVNVCRRFLKKLLNETLPNVDLLIARELLPIRPDRKAPRKSTYRRSHKFNYRAL